MESSKKAKSKKAEPKTEEKLTKSLKPKPRPEKKTTPNNKSGEMPKVKKVSTIETEILPQLDKNKPTKATVKEITDAANTALNRAEKTALFLFGMICRTHPLGYKTFTGMVVNFKFPFP